MRATVFGATGIVGKELIKQLLFKNYQVVAFGRNVHLLDIEHENLKVVKAGVFDKSEIKYALKNAEVVFSALGGDISGEDKTRSLGLKNIIEQMESLGLKRIVALGGVGVLQANNEQMIMETETFPKEFLSVSNEHLKAFQYLTQSNLEYTFVCPMMITQIEITGVYQVSKNIHPDFSKQNISAANLAQFMINESERNEFIRCKVGIAE